MNDEEDDFELVETFPTGEKYVSGSGVVLHERGIPLAVRVRSGSMDATGLVLEGTTLAFEAIDFIALGTIHHSLGSMEPPQGMIRQVVGKFTGKNERAEQKAARFQESVFLDLYSQAHEAPFRLEAAAINYRAFLGKDALYISRHNFYRLVVRIARAATRARLNESVVHLIQRRRDSVRTYPAVYDFELESQNDLHRLTQLMATGDLDLSRDNYTTEEDAEESEDYDDNE